MVIMLIRMSGHLFTGEELTVQQDNSNEHDHNAVEVLKDDVVVGLVPKEFSRVV